MKKFDVKRAMLALGTGAVMMFGMDVKAQDVEMSVGADVVSSYIWRGAYQTAASVQPSIGLSYGGLSVGVWGSTDLTTPFQEVDFTVGYEIAGFSIGFTDYYYVPGELFSKDGNLVEANLAYTFPESCPITVSWNTNIYNDDDYSSYFEVSYPFTVGGVDMSAAIGGTPTSGAYAEDFAIVNIGIGASKEIKVTDDYSMAVFSNFTLNPDSELCFLTFGASF